ncbi:hypothetical protein ACHAW5_005982 [Stephanodiscus triporus]|uniref:Uncharacterized protein n=1 Tax=Stephanodiscus triporus TaxID=2934178 RepID=A0ABD3NTH6_9STRA
MKTPPCFILAIVAAVAAFARTAEAGGRRNASAWNANSHRRFGARRTNGRPSFAVVADQSSPSAEVMDILVQDESPSSSSSSPPAESPMDSYHPRRIVADGARAAAVAFVSAAAIGGARHAIEMIGV